MRLQCLLELTGVRSPLNKGEEKIDRREAQTTTAARQ